jgi:hypothetical protein
VYTVAVSKRNDRGQDVTAVLECEAADVAATAVKALARLDRALADVGRLQALADEDAALRKGSIDLQATIGALEKSGLVTELLDAKRAELVAALQRAEAIKKERAKILARNA